MLKGLRWALAAGARPILRKERGPVREPGGRRWRLLDGRPAGGGEHRRGAFHAVVHWHVQVAGLGRGDVVHVQRPQAERLLSRAGYRRWNRVAEGEQEDGLGVADRAEDRAEDALAQPSAVRSAVTGKVTDLESSGWVKAQMAKRANYIRERVLPPLRAPGATVEGKKAARLLAAMDAEEAAEQRGKSSTMNVEA